MLFLFWNDISLVIGTRAYELALGKRSESRYSYFDCQWSETIYNALRTRADSLINGHNRSPLKSSEILQVNFVE